MAVDLEQPPVPEPSKDSPVKISRDSIWLTFAGASIIVVVAALIYLQDLNIHAHDGLKVFGSFWASGWAASHHLNPYAVYPLTWTFQLPGHPGTLADLNLSPPALLPFLQAIALLTPNVAVKVWTAISLLLFIGSAALLTREYQQHVQHRQIIWLLLGTAGLNMLWLGQDYSIFLALAVAAWLLLERNQHIAAGIVLGALIAAKPNYILWVLLLALIGRWRSSAVAIGVAAALSALPLAIYGPAVYHQWIAAVAADPHWLIPNDVSFVGIAARHGHRLIGEIAAAVLLIAACVIVLWKRPSLRDTSGIALSVAIVASPLAWYHYALLLAGPLFREKWGIALSLVLLLLMLPSIGISYSVPVSCLAGYFLWCGIRTARPAGN